MKTKAKIASILLFMLLFCVSCAKNQEDIDTVDEENTVNEEAAVNEETAVNDSDTIQLVRLQTYGMEYVSKLAASWSIMSDTYRIQVEKEDNDLKQAAFYDRTMMDIVSGQGPELMWVSETDMRTLAEKGALMDISELISEDVKEQLLPGVLQVGTVDGTLVGITPEVSFYTMLANASVWSEDSWTASDLMNLVESRDDWEWPFSHSIYMPNAPGLFYGVFAHSLTNSPYIDVENGISYFDGEEFIQTLNFCQKYGVDDLVAIDNAQKYQMMKDGTCAAQICYFYNGLQDFSSGMQRFEGCHIVGFPTNGGNGNYLYSEAYLVVNANAVHIDVIREFINYLLDYDNQYSVTWSPVRKDVLRDSVVTNPLGKKAILKYVDPEIPGYLDLETKPDGTTYLEEFMAFAESCVSLPYCPEAITDILGDELGAFFTGDKSVEDVADSVHRRVQLYLFESQ